VLAIGREGAQTLSNASAARHHELVSLMEISVRDTRSLWHQIKTGGENGTRWDAGVVFSFLVLALCDCRRKCHRPPATWGESGKAAVMERLLALEGGLQVQQPFGAGLGGAGRQSGAPRAADS